MVVKFKLNKKITFNGKDMKKEDVLELSEETAKYYESMGYGSIVVDNSTKEVIKEDKEAK